MATDKAVTATKMARAILMLLRDYRKHFPFAVK
jgi:hypothetical protein